MDLGRILTELFVILVASRIAAEAAERVRQPAVLAEIALGIVIGPSVLGWVHVSDAVGLLAEIGVILLLFEVGRQMNLREMRHVGSASLRVAVIGVAAPMIMAYPVLRALGVAGAPALFIAAAITATSVGITARVFGDLRALASPEGRIVLGAAVADDIIGLLVLTVVVRLATGGRLAVAEIAGIAFIALGFVVVATAVGSWIVPKLLNRVSRGARTEGTVLAIGIAVALGFARASSAAQLAPIVGAFVAGLAVGRSEAAEDLHRKLTPIGHFFIPIFFLQIGIATKVAVFGSLPVLGIAAAVGAVAIVGKLISGLGARRGSADRTLIGIAMIPRGEVGLIFASLGLSHGILDAKLYAVLLLVVLMTTVVTPPAMRRRIERRRARAVERSTTVLEPDGGWLRADAALVELVAVPQRSLIPLVGLQAARACASRRPGPLLVETMTQAAQDRDGTCRWDDGLRDEFFGVLKEGSARSWRFLTATGLLARLTPDLAAAIEAKPRDPFDLDQDAAPGFALVRDLRRAAGGAQGAAARETAAMDLVLLAALARDVFGSAADPASTARELAAAIGLPHPATLEVGMLAGSDGLLAGAATRAQFDEDVIIDLAAYIETPERAAGLYLLTLARGGQEPWERERLDELYRLVVDALAHPDLTGPSARNLVDRRAVEIAPLVARTVETVRSEIMNAPRRYLLTHDAATVAEHLWLLQARPARHEARIRTQRAGEEWIVHVAMLDRRGALAAVTGAFAAAGVEVHSADVSTWRNGLAVDTFRVTAAGRPDWILIGRQIESALAGGATTGTLASIEGVVSIDNVASPWHTIVEIVADDRTGLLARVSGALARAGLSIHSATVSTRDGLAVDTFAVTGTRGGKLDEAGERALRAAFAGRVPRRLSGPWRRVVSAAARS